MDYSKIDIRDAFFDKIYDFAAKDKNVIFITADADAFSLRKYKKDFPGQFINIGVAEQNLIAVAAGLALCGKKVYIYAIIPFITMRCYEHIKVNICSMTLPVTIIGLGSGLSFGNDGPTHHAMQDISVMRTLPEMTIFNPADSCSAAACAELSYKIKEPSYVRIDKGVLPTLYNDKDDFSKGLKEIRKVSDINIISTGIMSQEAIKVADELKKHSINAGVIDLFRVKRPDEKELINKIKKSKQIVTIEENSIVGGIGTIVSEILADNNLCIPLKRIALEDKQYFEYGTREWFFTNYGLDVKSITKTILKECKK